MDSSRALRGFAAVIAFVWATPLLAATPVQTRHSLQPEHRSRELTQVAVTLQVGGDLKLVTDGKSSTLPMSVVAELKYDECRLPVSATGLARRSLRYYHDARAAIKVAKGGETPSLATAHRLIAVDKPAKKPAILFCPSAALRREELDLIDVPGNTLLLDQLLPTEPVSAGQSWKLDDQALAELLGLDAVSWTDVESALGETSGGLAEIASAGSVSGAVGGVSTEIELKAKYKFDLQLKRITYLALLIKEKRSVGHIGPGLDTVAKLIVEIRPLSKSERLEPALTAGVSTTASDQLTRLSYAAPSGEFQFLYDRRWYLTSDDPKMAVLRYLDRGELVAQCNLSSLPGGSNKPVALAEFQRDVQDSLGKNFGQFTSASQSSSEDGNTVLRVVVHGAVSQLPIEWVYYLIADNSGHRVSLAFTYERDLGERFGQADRHLVSQVRLTSAPTPTAAKPVKTK